MRSLGILAASMLMVLTFVLSWLVPIAVSLIYGEYHVAIQLGSLVAIVILLCLCVYQICHQSIDSIRPRDGFLIVGIVWLVVSVISAIPYHLILKASLADSIFEAVSGITTTGIEVIQGIDLWPRSMVWFRQQLEFVGGVGIIIMTMSLMSFHEGAVLSIYHGEYGRDIRDFRVTPRLQYTARYVCGIYILFFMLCACCHYLLGVPLFFAMLESMATVSTGGFSITPLYPIYASSLNQFVAIVFMLLGAVGFHVHYAIFQKRLNIWKEVIEIKLMLSVICLVTAFCFGMSGVSNLTQILFDVVAFVTTTGFETTIQAQSDFITVVFWAIGIIGACAGSTCGGVKLVRIAILYQDIKLYLQNLIYPNNVSHITINGRVPTEAYVQGVRGFLALFMVTFIISLMVLVYLGMPIMQSFVWVSATLTNLGATIMPISVDTLTAIQKQVLAIIMVIGRVEIASLLVLCLPKYWR